MKHIVSVSLGSSTRDHKGSMSVFGEEYVLERRGTDGDVDKAISLLKELDGHVDAFGMGGIDLYLQGMGKKWMFKDAKRIAAAAQKTPLLDGTSMKSGIEFRAVKYAAEIAGLPIKGRKVFLVSTIDRLGMGEAFELLGCDMVYGDAMFALGLNWRLTKITQVKLLAKILAPLIVNLPFKWLYPTGKAQENKPKTKKWQKYYNWADVIAGDYIYISKYLPDDLKGKTIITNTVTKNDVEELKNRGADALVTTTPEVDGRSFGTNVMEAMLTVAIGKKPAEITEKEYMNMLDKLEVKPRIVKFI
jgi:hypothetical protein